MAKSVTTLDGTLFVPQAYSKYVVRANPSGLAATGILMLVGEANQGASFSQEADLEETAAFGPDQAADVIAKYGSGPLVDAFLGAAVASADQDITGSFTTAILVKTNTSSKASASLSFTDGGSSAAYGTLADKSYGQPGNLISYQVLAESAEALPTTSAFTYIPGVDPTGGADDDFIVGFRVNGGAQVSATVLTGASPASFVSSVNALTGVGATGGANRNILTVAGTLTVDQNPSGAGANVILVTRDSAWAVTPSIGDTLLIPEGSVIAGTANANVGAYVITAVSSTSVTATKLSDYNKTTPVPVFGTITTPVDVTPAVAVAATTDASAWAPVVISVDETSNAIQQGVGKSLEICELTTGDDLFSRYAYQLGTTTPVTWISKAAGAKLLVSASEYSTELALARNQDGVSESFVAGGEVALKISYDGTSATLSISATALTTTVVGGAGSNLSIVLADYRTIGDLAAYINAQPGYKAAAGSGALANLAPSSLDRVSAKGICTEFGEYNGRIKVDAYKFFLALQDSTLAQLGTTTVARAALGLPDATAAVSFLAGGAKGATTDALITAAIAACENVTGNFLVPLFSRDATLDIADGLTDAASTYTIAAINAAAKAHVHAQSAYAVQQNRQAVVSLADTFLNQKQAASDLASFRCAMAFQDPKEQDSTGSLVTFLPWMNAVKAAAMQAAGGYRNIENKLVEVSGFVHRAGEFNSKSQSQVKDALQAGLLVMKRDPAGGFVFVSDQTTYGRDNNFVFNSMQAVYAADTISRTLSQKLGRAIVGQSVADVSANLAKSFVEAVMSEILALKLIAPSDDAPKGFRNLVVRISGNVMRVSLEVKLATAIDFVLIDFAVTPVTQTAG